MNSWFAVLAASFAVFSWKMLGYLVPRKLLESKNLAKLAGYLTIGLMAGLVGVQTFTTPSQTGDGQLVTFDERLIALFLAGVLLKLKAPFIVVVVCSATFVAVLRLVF